MATMKNSFKTLAQFTLFTQNDLCRTQDKRENIDAKVLQKHPGEKISLTPRGSCVSVAIFLTPEMWQSQQTAEERSTCIRRHLKTKIAG